MKKFLAICAACVMLFACGSSNPGVNYLENMKKAVEKGDLELAQQYSEEFAEWSMNLTPEEEEKYYPGVEEWTDKYGEEVAEEMTELLMEKFNDGLGQIEDGLEEAADAAAEALESLLE